MAWHCEERGSELRAGVGAELATGWWPQHAYLLPAPGTGVHCRTQPGPSPSACPMAREARPSTAEAWVRQRQCHAPGTAWAWDVPQQLKMAAPVPAGQDATRERPSWPPGEKGSAHTPGFDAQSSSGTRSLVLQRLCPGPQGSRKTAHRTVLCWKGRRLGHPEAGQLLHLCLWGHRAGAVVPAACSGSAMQCVAGGPGAAPSRSRHLRAPSLTASHQQSCCSPRLSKFHAGEAALAFLYLQLQAQEGFPGRVWGWVPAPEGPVCRGSRQIAYKQQHVPGRSKESLESVLPSSS